MARLTRRDVDHVAALARLALTDEERNRLVDELAAILDHAARVQDLPVAGLAPTAHPIPLTTVLRDDVVDTDRLLPRDIVLAGGPVIEAGRFRVPPILGDSEAAGPDGE